MAFTTQKDVIKVGFLNQVLDPTCTRTTKTALKTYSSTTDTRALDSRRFSQAQYLVDLLACRTYSGDQIISTKDRSLEIQSEFNSIGQGDHSDDLSEGILSVKELLEIPETDSLLFRITEKLTDFENLLQENEKLKEEINFNNNKLDEIQKLIKENKELKEIIKNGDPSRIIEFENKIKKLKLFGKLNDNDVEELLNLRRQIGDRQKSIEIIEAENNALKYLAEKLSARIAIPEILIEKETNEDIPYLQNTINNLKQEICLLRSMEDEFTRMKLNYNKIKYDYMTAQQKQNLITKDAEHVKAIIDERNKLRHQLDKMISIEGKIKELREKAMKCDRLEKELKKLKDESQKDKKKINDFYKVNNVNEKLDKIEMVNDLKKAKLQKRLECIEIENNDKSCDKTKINESNAEIKRLECIIKKIQEANICLREKLQNTYNTIKCYECQTQKLMVQTEENTLELLRISDVVQIIKKLALRYVKSRYKTDPFFKKSIENLLNENAIIYEKLIFEENYYT